MSLACVDSWHRGTWVYFKADLALVLVEGLEERLRHIADLLLTVHPPNSTSQVRTSP